ncbi:MAG: hypothetical protein NC218_02290 [Acetobacter sp.]|nr:hypothetical protein [Acetobacter sp.]
MRVTTLIIGILASVLVLLSYIFSNQKKLRIINLVASIIFVIYGLFLVCGEDFTWTHYDCWPTAILNAFCAVVHIRWFIMDAKNKHKNDTANDSLSNEEKTNDQLTTKDEENEPSQRN